MKIILCEDVNKVGNAGDVKDVAEGFARNFLLPRKLALAATQANLKKWDADKEVRALRQQQTLESAKTLAGQLERVALDLVAKAGREGHLFGSVTSQMIADALSAKGFSIDKKHIVLDSPIKSVGEHPIAIKLHPQVTASLKLNVTSGELAGTSAPANSESPAV